MKNTIDMHDAIDDIWRSGLMTRNALYAVLSAHLRIPAAEMHLSKLESENKVRVVAFVRAFRVALEYQKLHHSAGVEDARKDLTTTIGERQLARGRR